jgi:hypothetical protein
MILSFLSIILLVVTVCYCSGSCSNLNNCNGHGKCSANDKCVCFEGWGSKSDNSLYKAPDCSARVCPSDIAWADLPALDGELHQLAECSNMGSCNRKTGKCKCSPGFTGAACQRMKCPNDCSGHGTCMVMERYSVHKKATPLQTNNFAYQKSNVSPCSSILQSFTHNILTFHSLLTF